MSTSVGCRRLTDSGFEDDYSQTFDVGCTIITSCYTQYKYHQKSFWVEVDTETVCYADSVWSNT